MDKESFDDLAEELVDIIRSEIYEEMTASQAERFRHALDNNHVVSFSIGIQAKDVDFLSIWERWTTQ